MCTRENCVGEKSETFQKAYLLSVVLYHDKTNEFKLTIKSTDNLRWMLFCLHCLPLNQRFS